MVIDLKRCTGCHACTLACKLENSTKPGIFWNRVWDQEVGHYPVVSRRFLPGLCMHCENAPCVEVCPTGASYKREDGIVLVDPDKCVGCKYCVVACPYGARYYNDGKVGYFGAELTPAEELGYREHKLGVVEKCTFCLHRVEQGREPACVQTCPTKARYFGDLDDPSSEVSHLRRSKQGFQLLKELGTDPSVYYLPP
ncbi:sulfate reduction electron transfer complex DsrMKJOP subunit DsrO [Thermodesulfobacteriota bacterium]